MARKLFEKQGIRTRAGALATGTVFVVYTDSAGTAPADISLTSGGSAIAGSTVTVTDRAGLGLATLLFYGPTDGTDTLYLRCPDDTSLGVQEVEADEDERLDALVAGSGIPPSLLDAKGDIIAASAADTAARLAAGANDTVLTADSTAGTGLKWSAPAAHPNLAAHDSLGLATDAELTTHAGAADPHTGYVLESLYDAKGDLLAASADNTPAKVTAGANDTALVADSAQSAGVKWVRVQYKNTKSAQRTAGSVVVNTAAFADVDTGIDIVLPAATGDIIEVSANGMWNNETSQNGFLDVATIVSAAVVNYVSGGLSDGIIAWQSASVGYTFPGPPRQYTLQAGDISAGTVRLRVRSKNPATGTKTLFATGGIPFYWQATNLGPSA